MTTIDDLIRSAEARLTTAATERKTKQDSLIAMRASVEAGETAIHHDVVTAAISERNAADAALTAAGAELEQLRAEKAADEEADRLTRSVAPSTARRPGYDQQARVVSEERTYAPHKERGYSDGQWTAKAKPGAAFEFDVAAAFMGDYDARDRLARHMREERVERGDQLQRAVGTSAFAGLVVPQYLTDMYAPMAAGGRPFADAIRSHSLPEKGMTVEISRITTATSVDLQATQNSAVAEANIDDTILSIAVQTNAGQQTMSRQSIERGTGTEAVVLDDLFRRYATKLDATLITQATNGLSAVATSVAYTDATPTTAELYPKVIEGLSGVEAALLDQASGDNLAVMHSRRWYWMQNAMGTSYPLITQPGVIAQTLGANYATAYGRGVRGILPNGTPVIVDNNIATNLGAGTNEDEIYLVDRQECHLWEDPSAPLFIRAEQPHAASLGVLLVVYGYFAYTHARQAHARKIAGTGLITPTFTGA